MPEIEKTIKLLKCSRCQYEWIPREQETKPVACPGCNSPYWNIPRKNKVGGKKK